MRNVAERLWFLNPGVVALVVVAVAGCKGTGTSKAAEIAEGHRLYLSYGCGACHGREGGGDGPAAASLKTQPRDFRLAGSFRGERSVESISRTIAEGFRGGVMPASPFIRIEERKLIAAYVLSLAPAHSGASARE